MKTSFFTVVAVALMFGGAVIAKYAGFAEADLVGFALTMLGAGLACSKLWKGRKESANKVLTILAMVLVGVGAFIAGLTGAVSESTVTTIIGYGFSLGLMLVGAVISVTANKTKAIE